MSTEDRTPSIPDPSHLDPAEQVVYDAVVDMAEIDPLDDEEIRDVARMAVQALESASYRIVKQMQAGWLGPYGPVPGGMDVDPARGVLPLWRDL